MKAYVTRDYGADACFKLATGSRVHRDLLMAERGNASDRHGALRLGDTWSGNRGPHPRLPRPQHPGAERRTLTLGVPNTGLGERRRPPSGPDFMRR